MRHLDLVTPIAAPPDRVFAASLDIDQHTASMSGSDERAVGDITTGQLALGDEVTWRARHLGRTWTMTSRITAYTAPTYFVDEQMSGPFKVWRHAHHFDPDGDGGTLMRDIIDFAAPYGPLGRLAEALVLDRYMTKLMITRNRHLATVTGR